MWTVEFSWFAQLLRAKCLICKPVSELRVRSKRNGGAVKGVGHPTRWKFFLAPGGGVGGGCSDGDDCCSCEKNIVMDYEQNYAEIKNKEMKTPW